MIQAWTTPNSALNALLSRHPFVELLPEIREELHFVFEGRERRIQLDDPSAEAAGLPELADNNPWVCADAVGIPGATATLMLIALGPLARAGLIVEPPVVLSTEDADAAQLERWMDGAGYAEGITFHHEPLDIGSVISVSTLTKIPGSITEAEILSLFAESFERSFFVRYEPNPNWEPQMVAGFPHAIYRYSLMQESPESLLRVQAMADRDGKCGAAQIVHAMNIMCGFEESLPFDLNF